MCFTSAADSDRFEIVAKADPDTTFDTLPAMLRALLIQRFHYFLLTNYNPCDRVGQNYSPGARMTRRIP